MRGYLRITYGCMFSGKTTELIKDMNLYIDSGSTGSVCIVNYSGDKRETTSKSGILTCHSTRSQGIHPSITQYKTKKLKDICFDGYQFVNIDESQFYPDLYEVVSSLIERGVMVHCAGLIGDDQQKKFGKLLDLFPMADDLIHRKARCHCSEGIERNAVFTKLVDGVEKKEKVMVGSDAYIPVCGKHL